MYEITLIWVGRERHLWKLHVEKLLCLRFKLRFCAFSNNHKEINLVCTLKVFMQSNFHILWKAHLVPLSLSVQRDDYHGWIHQVAVAVEGEVIVFPGYIQHVPVEKQNPRRKMISSKCILNIFKFNLVQTSWCPLCLLWCLLTQNESHGDATCKFGMLIFANEKQWGEIKGLICCWDLKIELAVSTQPQTKLWGLKFN